MEIMHERVAALDVHKTMIVACVRIMSAGKIKRECRTFETSTASLEALLGWLMESGCTHVAMEATGVYWKPVWNILSDGAFELIVANAALSGRRMIEAMIAGVRNPHKLAALADRRIKASPKVLYDALHGRMTEHHRFLLRLYLDQHDAAAAGVANIDAAVDAAILAMDEEVK